VLQGWQQGCDNIVISWLYWTCSNNLATSLIISTRLLQVVNSLFHTCWQLGTSSANTTCWRLVGRLATRCEIFCMCNLLYITKLSRRKIFSSLIKAVWYKSYSMSKFNLSSARLSLDKILLQPCVVNLVTFSLYHDCIGLVRTTL
jgi:hypothetical protein